MSQHESEDSPELERQSLSPPSMQSYSILTNPQQVEGHIRQSSGEINYPSVQLDRQASMVNPNRSPTRSIQPREIISPRPRLPSSLSTLLNQAETEPPRFDPALRGRQTPMVTATRRTSASPPRRRQLTEMAKTADNLPHPRPPIRPTLTGQRHSFHTSEVVRPAHPPRQAFQTFPPNRSRPSSPRPSAQEHMSRKHERSFPHLSETSLGQALSPRRTQYRRTASDDIPTSYIGSHEQRQYPQEMQRSATHPQPLHRVSRSIPQHYDEVASRAGTYAPGGSQYQSATSQVDAPQAEAWITPGRTPARVTSGWTANDLARYHDGYSDAMSAVMSGVGVIGRDTSFRINIHDPRKSAYQHAAPPSHPLSTTEVPPPQPPPQVYQPPARYRNENLRIDPSLQRPGTHRRPSQSSSNIPTPTVTTPLHKIHPPPASDYFGTAFHYSHPCATEHPPAKRPKRQSISCYPCRQRKLKCDGKKPCAQCSRRHIDGQCSYAERIRRRGRGKKATDEEQGLGDSEEHDYEGEDVPQAESSIMAQRRVGGVRSHDEERDEGDGDLSMDSALDSGSRPPGGLGSPVRYPSRGSKEEGEGEEEREKEY